MEVIIDRFEGQYAICENQDGTMLDLEKVKIPYDAKEGDILRIDEKGIFIDKEATIKRKNKIEELTKDLWGN